MYILGSNSIAPKKASFVFLIVFKIHHALYISLGRHRELSFEKLCELLVKLAFALGKTDCPAVFHLYSTTRKVYENR